MQKSEGVVSGRFMALHSERQSHLRRARTCAEVTIPSILPPEGYNHNTPLRTPYQGVGARCVSTLSAKTVLALFPPNAPFFRHKIDPILEVELREQLGEEDFKLQIEKGLALNESLVVDYIESIALRVHAYQMMRQLFVTGNVLVYGPYNGKIKVFRLDQYVVRRNPQGEPIEIIIKEGIAKEAIPPKIRPLIVGEEKSTSPSSQRDTLDLYTHVTIDDSLDSYSYYQEINGKRVPDSEGSYPKDVPLFNPVAINLDVDADYGSGLVGEHLGDFTTIESLSKSLVEGTAAMSKIVFMIDPNGTTNKKDLINASNTGFVSGRQDDVTVLQVQKFHDYQIPFQLMERIEERLNLAFLSHNGIQRQAERVTAFEIQFMAQELEDSLGGIYSVLSQELQAPLVRSIMADMSRQSKISFLPKGINPIVITGMEALGRGHDLQKLQVFFQMAQQILGDETRIWIKKKAMLDKIAMSVQFNAEQVLLSEEEVAQIQEQQQQQQMMMELGKPAVGPIAGAMAQQMGEQQ